MRVHSALGPAVIAVAFAWSAVPRPAVAGVVAVVSAKSRISTLSRDQIADIFLGRTDRYPNGDPAVPIDQVESSVARDAFYVQFAGKLPAQVKAHWSKVIFTGRGQPPPEVSTDVEVKKRLAADPNAIGYIDQSAVDPSIRVVVTR
jgi:ABC-type phosphate transport system substrate-binding protein